MPHNQEKKYTKFRVDYNAKFHFEILASQLNLSQTELLQEIAVFYCKPEIYEPKGLFDRVRKITS